MADDFSRRYSELRKQRNRTQQGGESSREDDRSSASAEKSRTISGGDFSSRYLALRGQRTGQKTIRLPSIAESRNDILNRVYSANAGRYQEEQAEYDRISRMDLDQSRVQLERLETERKQAEDAKDRASKILIGKRYMTEQRIEKYTSERDQAQKQYDTLNAQISALRKDIRQAENLKVGQTYAGYRDEGDFSKYSAQGAAIENPSVSEAEGLANILGWRPGAENVGNIVTYSRENYEKILEDELERNQPVGRSLYHFMTEDEVDIYNYLLAKEGEDSAQGYLDYLEETLNARQGGQWADSIRGIDPPFLRTGATAAYAAGAGIEQFGSGIRQMFSEERLPTTAGQFGSAKIREDLADTGPKFLGSSVGQTAYDLVTTAANMAPSILLSAMTAGAGAPALASTVGAASLGASASGNAYAQALQEGYEPGQARNYSILVGASEAALQYLLGGISSLGGKLTGRTAQAAVRNIDNALLRVAADIGINMAGEGTEEYLQEILEPAFRNLVFGEDNQIKLVSQDAAYAFLLGTITAGLMEGGGIAVNDLNLGRTGAALRESGQLNSLLERASALGEQSEARRMAEEMKSGRAASSDINAGQLFAQYFLDGGSFDFMTSEQAMQTEVSASAKQSGQQRSINDAIARMLEEQGLEGTAVQRQAAGVDMLINGGEMSSKVANELRKSAAAQDVYRQITGDSIDMSGTPGEIRQRLRDMAASRMEQNVSVETTIQATDIPSTVQPETAGPTVTDEPATAPMAGTELGEIASEVQRINQVDRMAANSQVLGPVGKNAAVTRYDGTTDPDVYYQGYMQAYNAGMSNKRGQIPSVLTRQQYNDAFKAGRLDARSGNRGGGLVQSSAASRLSDAGTIDALARKLGVSVVAEETISGPDGRRSAANGYIKDGVIHIALDAEDPAMVVFKHEVTHLLQERGAKEYAAFRDYAVQTMGEAEVDRIQSLYRENGVELSRDGAMDEVAANFTERLLTDEKAVRLLIRDDRNIAQKIFDAIRDMARKLTGKEGAKLREAEKMWTRMFEEGAEMRPLTAEEQAIVFSDRDTKYSIREKDPPKKTGVAYKVFFAKDGQLYPPMVANPGGAGTPVGVWLDADVGQAAPPSKTGRAQVQAGGKGTNAAKGSLAFRPGWHLGDIPLAKQFARKNPETGVKDLFPADFVWAECEYAMDVDYQEEAMSYGYTENGKFRHSYAGLPKLPTDGYYRYRTNPNPDTVPWVITGAMKVNRILTDAETDAICREAGVEPMQRQGGPMDAERLSQLGLKAGDVESDNTRFSMKSSVDEMQENYDNISRRVQELSRKKAQLEKNPEHEKFLEAVYSAKGDALDAAMEQYKKWSDENGLSDIANELAELQKQSQEAYRSLERAKADALNEARTEYRAKFDDEFSKKYASKAARKFGTTSRFDLAGYLTVNGSLLNFPEGQGYRVQDHREIAQVLDFLPDYHEYSDGMIEFMNMGNIRLQSYGIDIAKAPNAKQRSMLRRFFQSLDGEVTVDFSLENGNSAGSIDYQEGTRPDRILRDIDSYFETGVVPEQSEVAQFHTRYSIKQDSQGRQLTKEQQEYFRDSKVVDSNGNLLVLYHGTGNEFTVFDPSHIEENFQNRGGDLGFYFTPYKSEAAGYARNATWYKSDGMVMSVYLNLTNPLIVEDEGWGSAISQADIRHGDLARWARDGGHDGIIVRSTDYEMDNGEYDSVYIAFSPEQVKSIDNVSPTSDPDIRFSLRKENERLRELNRYLREEVSDPSVVRTNRNAVKKLAGTMLRDYDSTMDRSELTDRLMGLYDYIANGKDAGGNDLTWTEVNRQANDIAQDILSSAVAQGNPLYEEYADVRSYAKRQAVVVPQSSRGDFEQFGGWGEFRKRNAGRLKLMNDGLPSDVFYQELSSQWPELFPDDIINPADQMIHTAEMLQYLDAVYENPYSMELDVYRRYLADQILEEFYEVPERRTFAQRQQQNQTRQAIRYEKRISDLRQRKKDRVADLRRQGRERVKEAITAQRTESQKKLEALKKKYQSKDAATRERREAAATRAKIERHVKKLSQLLLRPSDKSHVPESLKKPVADLLASINLESQFTIDPETGKRVKGGTGDPVKRTQAFQELRTAYAEIAKDGEYLIDPDLQDNLDAVIKLKDKRLSEMTQAELEKVWRSVRAMEASIQSANKLLAKSKFESVAALADNIRVENSEKREKKNYVGPIGKVDGLLNLDMMTPETFFHRLGDGGDALFRMMRNAADEQTRILKEAEDYTKNLLDGMDARKLEKEMHTVRVGGRDIEMSTAQIMELYVLSRRKQAIDHLYVGGIRTTGAQKGLVETGFVEPVHVTPDEVGRIVSTLTPEQIRVADGMQKFLSEEMAEKGNRTSMRVYGYKKFNEKFYWPIRVDSNQTITDITKEGAEKMVPQYGMTKQITPKANNALFIGSIFDSYAKHITEMSIYSAWLATWEDVNRVHNFQFRNQEGQRTGTVKTVVQKVFGKNGNAYITNLLKDVSQGTKSNADTIFSVRGLTSAYKAAAVGANLRVILQQPTAALRALDVIEPKYFLEGMARKGDWEKVKKWSPIAQWKDWGYFEMDTGRAIKDVILGTDSLLEKTKQGAMWAAGKADSLTWSRLWNACEAEISDKRPGLKKGSDDFYKAVADRFNQVIDQTQVVDSVLHRTQIMRSSSELNKMAASFMSEPSKVYNMLLRSVYDMRSAIRPEARVAARKKVGRTAFALVASFAVNAIAQSLIDGLRDDDRDKKYWEKYAAAYQKNFTANFNPAGYVPYLRDIVSIIQGYDVSRMDMDSISKIVSSATNAYKALTGESKNTVKSAFANLFFEASRLFGVPVANVKRDVMAVVMTAAIETDNYLLQYRIDRLALNLNYPSNSAHYMDILYNAMKNDREAYEIIYADLVENGFDPEKISGAMESRMKKDQGVESVEDLTQRFLAPGQEERYQSTLSKMQSSSVWSSASEEQRKNAEDDLYQIMTGTDRGVSLQQKIDAGKEYGISEEDFLLYELAKEVASTDGNSNTSQAEAEAAAGMISGLSDDARGYLWQSTNKSWKQDNNPWW